MIRSCAIAAVLAVVTGALVSTVRHVRTFGIIPQVRAAIAVGNLQRGDAMLAAYRSRKGDTPEAIEALSWLGRGELERHDLDHAETYSAETYLLATSALGRRPLDAESHLPIALGAAIEVQAQASADRGDRSGAVGFLTDQLTRFRSTSIGMRIQKNINLLTLEGKPVPPLAASEFLGPRLPALQGRPVLLFFWAHWCPDCKAEAPIIAAIEARYRRDGLVVIGPTQRYGYVRQGTAAPPAEELAHIDDVRRQYYGAIAAMPVPVSADDFQRYGVSTTPTLVLVDRAGIVTMYHPGRMTREALESGVKKTLESSVGEAVGDGAGGLHGSR